MALRPCLGSDLHPAGHTLIRGNRCSDCTRWLQQVKDAKRPDRRTWHETQRRRTAVAEHVAVHGWLCPGDQAHDPHPCTDLTAHHVEAVGSGGSEHSTLAVLCRSRNSAIGNRTA